MQSNPSGVMGARRASYSEWAAARARRTDGDVVGTLEETGVPARPGPLRVHPLWRWSLHLHRVVVVVVVVVVDDDGVV